MFVLGPMSVLRAGSILGLTQVEIEPAAEVNKFRIKFSDLSRVKLYEFCFIDDVSTSLLSTNTTTNQKHGYQLRTVNNSHNTRILR